MMNRVLFGLRCTFATASKESRHEKTLYPCLSLVRGVGRRIRACRCAATPEASGAGSAANVAPDKVVYHVNDAAGQAVATLRNIGNHLEVNPQAKIVVVTHAQGVDFLMEGAKDKNGNPLQHSGGGLHV